MAAQSRMRNSALLRGGRSLCALTGTVNRKSAGPHFGVKKGSSIAMTDIKRLKNQTTERLWAEK
jgi:hypothetical protein